MFKWTKIFSMPFIFPVSFLWKLLHIFLWHSNRFDSLGQLKKKQTSSLLQKLTIHPRQENYVIELRSSMVWLISWLPEDMRKLLKITPKLACLNAKVWFPRPGNTRVRSLLLVTSEPGLKEEKPYKIISGKKLPFMSRKVNPKRQKSTS